MDAASVIRVKEAALRAGVVLDVQEFPSGTHTAQAAADAVGVDLGQIAKSLVFMADGAPVVALVSGSNRLDVAKLATACGVGHVKRADAETVKRATGYSIGGVPPFGHAERLPVYVDLELMCFETVWAAAGTARHNFPIAPADLVRCALAVVADLRIASSDDAGTA